MASEEILGFTLEPACIDLTYISPRRTSSVFFPTSRSFSARNYSREYYLLGNLFEFICFICFASTSQHSTAQSTRTSSKASGRRSERDNASRQSWLEPACRRGIYTARCVFKANEKIETCPAYKSIQPLTNSLADVMLPVHCSFSPSFLIRSCM